jgi:hypothetical protein
MLEHRVSVTDCNGLSMKILIHLSDGGSGTWRTLDKGFFRYEQGVADVGYSSTSPFGWLALYGGDDVDDSKLVLHLDNFRSMTTVQREGKGKIYVQDFILMRPGEASWQLVT